MWMLNQEQSVCVCVCEQEISFTGYSKKNKNGQIVILNILNILLWLGRGQPKIYICLWVSEWVSEAIIFMIG